MIYLDNAATTFPKPESVYRAMDKMNREGAVNAGRGSYRTARQASKLISDTKAKIRDLIHVDSNTAVVFTASITIALNQIVNGLQLRNKAIIYVSPYEHNAVARSLHELSKKKDLTIKELPLNQNLEIDLEQMKYDFALDKPEAVFCTHVSNVTGYILPVVEIFNESKKYNAINVLDTAQSLGLVDICSESANVDILAFAGHKTLYGPFGIGGFVNITNVPLDIFISGGTGSDSLNLEMPNGNESRYESSSCNVIAVAGLYAALCELNPTDIANKESYLTKYLVEQLKHIDNVQMCVPPNPDKHVGVVSFIVQGFSSEDIGMILDEDYDIAVRTGYHCAPFIHKYLKDFNTLGTVRVGISQFTTKEDIDKLIRGLREIIDE